MGSANELIHYFVPKVIARNIFFMFIAMVILNGIIAYSASSEFILQIGLFLILTLVFLIIFILFYVYTKSKRIWMDNKHFYFEYINLLGKKVINKIDLVSIKSFLLRRQRTSQPALVSAEIKGDSISLSYFIEVEFLDGKKRKISLGWWDKITIQEVIGELGHKFPNLELRKLW